MKMRPSSFTARAPLIVAIAVAGLALAACTSTGVGSGYAGQAPVTFNWISKDGGISGTMSATTSDGDRYTGNFVQVTKTISVEALAPMWDGWNSYWRDWGVGTLPITKTAEQYSGKVIANLRGPSGAKMRCRFTLNAPMSGMGGGGQGECQTGTGKAIDAVFPKG